MLEHVYYFLSVKVCIKKKRTLFKKPKETHGYPASLQQITALANGADSSRQIAGD